MKKILVIMLFVIYSAATQACPYCGCGNSNFQIGVLPTFSNAFVGVRYSYANFKTDSGSMFSRDYFHTTEVWGGYKRGKFQAMVFVPYISIHKNNDDGGVNSAGLGDITVLGNYLVFSKTTSVTDGKRYFGNVLWVGGGIKLATGQSKVDVTDHCFSVGDFTGTPGTGSTDYLLNLNHNLFWGSSGLVTNVAYKMNTNNNQQYRYGNRFYFNTAYFYSLAAGSFTIRPSAGVNFVVNSFNHYQAREIQQSAGYVLDGMVGINVQRNKIGLLMNGFMPVAQDLFHGLTQSKERASVALTYSF
ncbi:MAG: hypothetical protein JSS93_09395 [Bacteroidetes bacterium]|nr:hypothetical protein [Bacteroidota bacterium]